MQGVHHGHGVTIRPRRLLVGSIDGAPAQPRVDREPCDVLRLECVVDAKGSHATGHTDLVVAVAPHHQMDRAAAHHAGRDRTTDPERIDILGTKSARYCVKCRGPMVAESALESTATLPTRVRAGDGDAREQLVVRYLVPMKRWAHGRVPPRARGLADTDDLVQVTPLRALNAVPHFEPRREGAFLAYLREILLNQLRTALQRVDAGPPLQSLSDGLEGARPSPLTEADWRGGARGLRGGAFPLDGAAAGGRAAHRVGIQLSTSGRGHGFSLDGCRANAGGAGAGAPVGEDG